MHIRICPSSNIAVWSDRRRNQEAEGRRTGGALFHTSLETDCTRPGQGLYRLPLQSAGYCDTPLVLRLPLSIPLFLRAGPSSVLAPSLRFASVPATSSPPLRVLLSFTLCFSSRLVCRRRGRERSLHTGPPFLPSSNGRPFSLHPSRPCENYLRFSFPNVDVIFRVLSPDIGSLVGLNFGPLWGRFLEDLKT